MNDVAAESFPLGKKDSTFHEDLILGHALEQFVVLRVVLADSLCRGTGQSHEQLLGGPACLHSASSASTTGHSGSTRRRHHPLPQRTRALHQAQHVGSVHTHTVTHIQGLEQAAARHTLFPCRRSVCWAEMEEHLCATTSSLHARTNTHLALMYTHTRTHHYWVTAAMPQFTATELFLRNYKALFLCLTHTLQHPADTLPLLLPPLHTYAHSTLHRSELKRKTQHPLPHTQVLHITLTSGLFFLCLCLLIPQFLLLPLLKVLTFQSKSYIFSPWTHKWSHSFPTLLPDSPDTPPVLNIHLCHQTIFPSFFSVRPVARLFVPLPLGSFSCCLPLLFLSYY